MVRNTRPRRKYHEDDLEHEECIAFTNHELHRLLKSRFLIAPFQLTRDIPEFEICRNI